MIITRYVDSHRFLNVPNGEFFQASVEKIMRWNLDCEALEFYWRLIRRERTLSMKFSILFFLTENQSAYFDIFYQKENQRLKAWLNLAGLGLRSGYLLVKGFFLDRWLRFV